VSEQATDHELVRLIQSRPLGDPDREAACGLLVERHRSIVRSCVARYRDSPEPTDDLMQVGYVGLLKAINSFDPGIGDSLAAYAQVTVSGEVKRHFRDKRWHIRVKRSTQELRLEVRKTSAELTQRLARTPCAAELADQLQVTEADVLEAQLADRAFQPSSLDAPLSDQDGSYVLSDVLGQEDPSIERTVDIESVSAHWSELPAREQQLLLMRFYGNMTQAEIGAQLGISQMHVSRLLARALAYLRQQIAGPAPSTEH
jgi:RNA polymerase sigma-B factor